MAVAQNLVCILYSVLCILHACRRILLVEGNDGQVGGDVGDGLGPADEGIALTRRRYFRSFGIVAFLHLLAEQESAIPIEESDGVILCICNRLFKDIFIFLVSCRYCFVVINLSLAYHVGMLDFNREQHLTSRLPAFYPLFTPTGYYKKSNIILVA